MAELIAMCGLPGCGKSTLAAQIPHDVIVCKDDIREEICGNAEDQSQNRKVHQIALFRMCEAIRAGKRVILDCTNLTAASRKTILDMARKAGASKTSCLFFLNGPEGCKKRQKSRSRQVPGSIIDSMFKTIEIPVLCEGWDEIVNLF